jgi:hypothetical protein
MIKCPDCAEENIYESLFCKHCGRCLLAPDPEKVHWWTVTYTDQPKIHEEIDFSDSQIVTDSRTARLKPSYQAVPPVIGGWLLVLNVLVIIFVAEIVMYLTR